ncbi:hypothetical protein GCM10009775_32730 [Microbacterium aoyamense]|uniref:HTH luxR-type domain-containing protein n=1 Tax=Microbacterium aoyamense TaxID=344166 RepID=A0ABN2PY94_9MICO|nr:LuxR C-terminal-related transcriptional regulator [Microbacterium aoyamense]
MTEVRRFPLHAVDRPSLRAQLDVGATAPITLLVAPAGSGKTVLLAQWMDARIGHSVAWLDVSRSDHDASIFSRHLIEVIAAVDPRLSSFDVPIGTPEGGLGEPFIEAFAVEMSSLDDVVVVFDDLHNLAGSAIVADLWRLVDRLPPNVHFVFASRVDLQIGRSRHRVRHGLVEMRQAELAFTPEVTARVLESITGADVSLATAAAVTHHTEGWAAGVQLSGLSMRFQEHPERFIEHLDASNRLIVDYMSEEVFDAQQPERREALLRLSVLDEVCAGLAESVAGVTDGDGYLRQLERDSMFIVSIPGRIGWYRFHHLFRDLLRFRIRAESDDRESALLRAAAAWHLQRGETTTAVEYLLRARAWDDVCDIVLASGPKTYEQLRTTTVARWLSLVPDEVRWANPRVELLYGMVVGMSGRGALTVEIMQRLLTAGVLDVGGQQVALSYLATCVYFQPRPDQFLGVARRSLTLLADNPHADPPNLLGLTTPALLETVSRVALSRAHFLQGDIPEARGAIQAALSSEGSGYGPYRVQIVGTFALIEAWSGRLDHATTLAGDALELARELSLLSHPSPAEAHIARAIVAVQRGESEAGAYSLHEGNIRAAVNQRAPLMWVAHLAAALVDPRGTESAAIEPQGAPPPLVARGLSALAWRTARLSGAPRDPRRHLESHWSTIAFEQVASLIELGLITEARSLIDGVCYVADASLPSAAVEYGLASAWLASAEGRGVESRRQLSDVLNLAERENLKYPILAAGRAVIELVKALPGPTSHFREQLIRMARPSSAGTESLPTALTAREVELLDLLPTRLTNVEIADRWYVSVNTIKSHLAHMYRKMGVADRNAAIVRARQLGLLAADGAPSRNSPSDLQ